MNSMPVESEDTGYVISTEGDFAWVQLFEQGNCEDCSAKILCKAGQDGTREMKVFNPTGARRGAKVTIKESDNLLLQLGFMQFGLPLLGLVSGILIANLFSWENSILPRELTLFIFGIFGLICGGFITYFWSSKVAGARTYLFRIDRILPETH